MVCGFELFFLLSEVVFERRDDGVGCGVGGGDDFGYAVVAKSGGGDGADGGDGDFVLQGGERFPADQVGEIVDGAGAEEEGGVGIFVEDFGDARAIDVARWQRVIGDDFGDGGAEFFEGGGQIGIGAVAAREEDGFVAELLRELFGEGEAEMGFGDVSDVQASFHSGFVCGRADGGDLRAARLAEDAEIFVGGALGDGLDGVGAGEEHPVEFLPAM